MKLADKNLDWFKDSVQLNKERWLDVQRKLLMEMQKKDPQLIHTKSATKSKPFIQARGDLFGLNANQFNTIVHRCSLCNMGEDETMFHFLGRCPILGKLYCINLKSLIS
ncbi:uncharacterized protein LOC142234374 [Haematobia irritans]|uniref:uncharacterized protein LOC142234374 n=1 Tax=Haematobia irritans TaxID=7368 RepID=UPI003F50707E